MNNDKIDTMDSSENLNRDGLGLSLTIDGEKGINLFKKTEKIVKGLHLATQHISDSSSLRKYIRENSIGLIECVSEFTLQSVDISEVIEQKLSLSKSASPTKYLTYKRSELNRRIQVTMSYVDLAVSTGYMSYKNASILSDNIVSYKNEMNVFLDSIESYLSNLAIQLAGNFSTTDDYQKDIETRYPQGQVSGVQNPIELELSDSFFETSEVQVPLVFGSEDPSGDKSKTRDSRVVADDRLKDKVVTTFTKSHSNSQRTSLETDRPANQTSPSANTYQSYQTPQQSSRPVQEQPKKTIVQKFSGSRDDLHTFLNSMGNHPAMASSTTVNAQNNSVKNNPAPVKNDRQVAIINTIKEKGELSIKDLTDVIQGCSEKTIQRELISLVTDGILYKTGERRWSRYSLAV